MFYIEYEKKKKRIPQYRVIQGNTFIQMAFTASHMLSLFSANAKNFPLAEEKMIASGYCET